MANLLELSPTTSSRKEFFAIPTVDSSNLLHYLTWGYIPRGTVRANFAPYLNLSIYTPFIEELYKNKQFKPNDIGKEIPVEANRLIYRAFEPGVFKGKIKATDIIYGNHNSTCFHREGLKGWILLELHTHPDNDLFSNSDYGGLISSAGLRRATYGAIVLCPDIQVLALATPQSIMLEPEEASKYLFDLGKEFWEKVKPLCSKEDALKKEIKKIVSENCRQNYEIIEGLTSKVKCGELTHEETCHTVNDIKARVMQHKKMREAIEEIRVIQETKKKTDNMYRLIMARNIDIKLYSSRNMKDFKEFTA